MRFISGYYCDSQYRNFDNNVFHGSFKKWISTIINQYISNVVYFPAFCFYWFHFLILQESLWHDFIKWAMLHIIFHNHCDTEIKNNLNCRIIIHKLVIKGNRKYSSADISSYIHQEIKGCEKKSFTRLLFLPIEQCPNWLTTHPIYINNFVRHREETCHNTFQNV